MGFCNSCGRPMGRNDYGTNEDGSPNMDYCKDCFQNGEFTEPDITINEMIIRHAKRMLKRNPDLREEEATGLLCNFLPNLKRWNPNPEDEIDEDETLFYDLNTMQYFTAGIDDVLQKIVTDDGLECYIISTPFDVMPHF